MGGPVGVGYLVLHPVVVGVESTGLWCDPCALPTGLAFAVVALVEHDPGGGQVPSPHGVWPLGRLRRCAACQLTAWLG